MAATPAMQSALKSWFWATRPFSLSASVAPVLVGAALAASYRGTDWLLFALVLTASVAIQIGTNLTDEYADFLRQGAQGKLLAPHKVIQRGLLSERAVLYGILGVFGYATAVGLYIVSQTGWPILAVGLASVTVAYFYSAGPYSLGKLGLGEPVVFVFMGPVMVMGTFYVLAGDVRWDAFLVSLPVAFIVTAILHMNNLRDIEEDQAVGKRSIAAAIGVTASRWAYAGLLAAAYGAIVAMAASGAVTVWALLGLLPVPFAFDAARKLFATSDRPAMNKLMVRSAEIHGWTGVTLAAGLAIAAL